MLNDYGMRTILKPHKKDGQRNYKPKKRSYHIMSSFVMAATIKQYMTHCQMLGKFEYGLPAKF